MTVIANPPQPKLACDQYTHTFTLNNVVPSDIYLSVPSITQVSLQVRRIWFVTSLVQ